MQLAATWDRALEVLAGTPDMTDAMLEAYADANPMRGGAVLAGQLDAHPPPGRAIVAIGELGLTSASRS
jgi:hypothetical protein